jgi:hypothetical protein
VRRETSVVRRVVGVSLCSSVHAVRSVVIFTTETRRSRRFTEYCVVSVLCVPLCTLCLRGYVYHRDTESTAIHGVLHCRFLCASVVRLSSQKHIESWDVSK